jgi:hypothetical protein
MPERILNPRCKTLLFGKTKFMRAGSSMAFGSGLDPFCSRLLAGKPS